MNGRGFQSALLAASLVAAAMAGIRWLRVAQREHYLPGSVVQFARRWWSLGPNRLLGAAAVVGLIAAGLGVTPAGLAAAAAVACGPFGLTLRGRTAKLKWTRRLRTLAIVAAAMMSVLTGLGLLTGGLALGGAVAIALAVASPLVVDAALAVTGPIEERLGAKFVDQAAARLRSVHPKVVAITGSYGKTGTKGYVAHLVTGSLSVIPTPASFNNRAGLARAINEHLTPGTDVFVAEMGTYGPGEIAAMCEWCPPDIAVITAIGPVHLERMGNEANIAAAKAEITAKASVAVLNVDHELLAAMADQVEASGKQVRRCSATDTSASVSVLRDGNDLRVLVPAPDTGGRRQIATAQAIDAPPANVACAVAVALELGVRPEEIARRLPTLPTAAHRRQVTTGRTGATIIDDTYNANPAGAAAALDLLTRLAQPGRRLVVVTPGMVELGEQQYQENARFAEAAAKVATDLVIVGQTNAPALMAGVTAGAANQCRVVRVVTREQAVAWVAEHVEPGDVVLYENDLPDHFP
jgi:UDP-N-acetylmuramoyl-tripeptide--D-alanyl-D-alanine ligase